MSHSKGEERLGRNVFVFDDVISLIAPEVWALGHEKPFSENGEYGITTTVLV